MIRSALASITITVAVATPLEAAETAQRMRSYCQAVIEAKSNPNGSISIDENFLSGWCWGAFGALQNLGRLYDTKPTLGFCAPAESTLTQHAAVFSAYTDKHPERLHEDWYLVALTALQEAFPCR